MSVFADFIHAIPHTFMEVLQAMAPMVVVFIIFQFTVLRLRRKAFFRIIVGLLYAFIGLLFFLVGINVGFMPAGNFLGVHVAEKSVPILVLVGLALGFVVVIAEPAVQVLNDQVHSVSGGNITKSSMLYSLSIGVAIAVALAMLRIVFGFSIWWYIIPGYLLSFLLMKFTPPVFTSIAFDSGGVASGPMSATFILAFALGAADSLGRNVMASAFGTVAMIAMTPLLTIQVMGIIYGHGTHEIDDDFNELQAAIENSGDEIELYDSPGAEYNTEEDENV